MRPCVSTSAVGDKTRRAARDNDGSMTVSIVTGANSGIGKAIAEQLARLGHEVAIVCRSEERGLAALADLERAATEAGAADAGARARLFLADLSTQADVRRVAGELSTAYPKIDVLVNNAGLYVPTRRLTPDGLETMFALNHLGYFLLTALLAPRLEAGGGGRVVSTSSVGHKAGHVDFDDLSCERSFSAMRQYCTTKLENVLFTRELHRRAHARGIVASCFHPGAVASNFAQSEPGAFGALVRLGKIFLRSPERAARTGVLLATAKETSDAGGKYYANEKARTPSREAQDGDVARKLWDVSERLTSVRYPPAA